MVSSGAICLSLRVMRRSVRPGGAAAVERRYSRGRPLRAALAGGAGRLRRDPRLHRRLGPAGTPAARPAAASTAACVRVRSSSLARADRTSESTVLRRMPSSAAASPLVRPEPAKSSTCRSRGLSRRGGRSSSRSSSASTRTTAWHVDRSESATRTASSSRWAVRREICRRRGRLLQQGVPRAPARRRPPEPDVLPRLRRAGARRRFHRRRERRRLRGAARARPVVEGMLAVSACGVPAQGGSLLEPRFESYDPVAART